MNRQSDEFSFRAAQDVEELLDRLLVAHENEVVEFKMAATRYDDDKLGQYVSALANEANLKAVPAGWLIFGVTNERQVVGTRYRPSRGQLEAVKQTIAEGLNFAHGIAEIHEVQHPNGRVLIFEIPSSPQGIPIAWKGKFSARNGESLGVLSTGKLDEIRRQVAGDWSAELVAGATVADLDPDALAAARKAFGKQHEGVPTAEVDSWGTIQFLEKAGLAERGSLNRACIILLGAPQASRLLGRTMPEVTWRLANEERVYEHYGLPFFNVADRVHSRIRNYQVRLLQPDALVQTEVSKYDPQSILEAVHNCIAHLDYRAGARISVLEYSDRIVFDNAGEFYDGAPEDYILGNRQARKYRNPKLVQAMTSLNMIDRVGYGIKKMSKSQVQRFLPLPDFDLNAESVRLTVYGAEIDENYTSLLMQHTDLDLTDIFALDRVQKGLRLPPEAVKRLRRAKLVEGRVPHLRVSASVAAVTGTEAEYMRTRQLDDEHYMALLRDYIAQFAPVRRADLDDFIWDKLHGSLSDEQKSNKIKVLLRKLQARGMVEAVGRGKGARWTSSQ